MHPLTRPGVNQDNLRDFIGNNAEKIIRRGSRDISWCWPAFFFSFLWFAYRKAYMAAIAVFLLEFVFQIVSIYSIIALSGTQLFHPHYSILLVRILIALFAMRVYLGHASKKVAEINAQTADASVRKTLYEAKGRTSVLSLVGFMLLSLLLSSILWVFTGFPEHVRADMVQQEAIVQSTQSPGSESTSVTVQNSGTTIQSTITTSSSS
ncbi:MAG: hypothetical protein K0Q57_811 [Gammaproteobacteria bacterium]|nr:hypothetical protein [Gammaproteobacteria bacterium]